MRSEQHEQGSSHYFLPVPVFPVIVIFTGDFLQIETTSFTFKDLTPETEYEVEVSASNVAGIRQGILPAKASLWTKERGKLSAIVYKISYFKIRAD